MKLFLWGFMSGCVWMLGTAFAIAVAFASKDEYR
jgi:hypothetical protein